MLKKYLPADCFSEDAGSKEIKESLEQCEIKEDIVYVVDRNNKENANRKRNDMGKLFCLIGKSASGKDAIFRYLRDNKELGLKEIVPYTTRPMRKGEENGVGYYFVDQAAYEKMCQNGKVIESRTYETINGPWHYFTVDDGQIDIQSNEKYVIIGMLN